MDAKKCEDMTEIAAKILSANGYTHEGNEIPGKCPVCKSPSSQFTLLENIDEVEVQNVENTISDKEKSGIGILDHTKQEQLNDQGVVDDNLDNNDNKAETTNKSVIQDNALCSEEDEKEILKFGAASLMAVKWYKEKHSCGLKEAKDIVDYVFTKHGKQVVSSVNNKGCMITIIIAITSTLSVICCL